MHYAAVRRIVKSAFVGLVYNLGVAEDASYTVEGVLCANCRCGQRWVHTSEAEAEGLPVGGAE